MKPGIEDVGVQILSTMTNASLTMPILSLMKLDPNSSSRISDCPLIALKNISSIKIKVKCTFKDSATSGVKFHFKASENGLNYDTLDLFYLYIHPLPSQTVSDSLSYIPSVKYLKLFVENLDSLRSINNILVSADLVFGMATDVSNDYHNSKNIDGNFNLSQNYPNPFNNYTVIEYELSESGYITLEVYNVLGVVVDKLIEGYKPKGKHKINFENIKLSTGIYFYKLQVGNFYKSKKFIILK